MSTPSTPTPRAVPQRLPGPPRRVVVRVVATQLLLAAVVGVAFVVMYGGLQRDPQPHGLPVTVVGSASSHAARRVLGSAVDVETAPDAVTARRLVREGSEIAAFSVEGRVLRTYVAGPNGLAENGAAAALGSGLAKAQGRTAAVVDLVPLLPFDPRALASFYTVLGVTVGSFILAQALYALRAIAPSGTQFAAIGTFAVLIATLIAVVVGPLLQLVPVPLVELIPALTLLSIAVSTTARALTAWFNSYGITAATLLMTAVGLSVSGGIVGRDLLPAPIGALGAILPPGAGFRTVVDLGYFGAERALPALVALVVWACAGTAALLLHGSLARRHDEGGGLTIH